MLDPESNILFTNEHIKNFFFSGIFSWMSKLEFVGLSYDPNSELTLFRHNGSYYEPFVISEYKEGSYTEALFIAIDTIFSGFEVNNIVWLGFGGFSREEYEKSLALS